MPRSSFKSSPGDAGSFVGAYGSLDQEWDTIATGDPFQGSIGNVQGGLSYTVSSPTSRAVSFNAASLSNTGNR